MMEGNVKIIDYEQSGKHLIIKTSKGIIRVQPYSAEVIRITYTKESAFSQKKSLMVVADEQRKVDWHLEEDKNQILFKTNQVCIAIDKKTVGFTYLTTSNELLVKEPKHGGKRLEAVDVIKNIFNKNAQIKEDKSIDGIRVHADDYTAVVDRKAYQSKLEFEFSDDEAIYGLGSHEEGILNYRGHNQYLYQQNLKGVVPTFISTKGYGILIDSYSLITFHDDVYGSYIKTDVDDELDFYFIYGPEFDQIISNYRMLTGKAPMLPKWAFGYVQSKERYVTQEELISVVQEYRNRKIPLDMIVLDWKSWSGELWGQKTFDLERFPNPQKMVQDIHNLNAKMMISIWPNMRRGGENHAEMLNNGFLLGNQSTYDAFNKKARELYWQQANQGLFSKGIDAWWCDCTEPFEADWKGEIKPEPEQRVIINTDEAKKYIDPEYINAYSLLHSKGIYEGQRGATDEKRVVNLTRSSYAGQHRYATITWSGDTSASWTTLKRQVADGLNFCVTGEPYWTTDIGAFFAGGKNCWSVWRQDDNLPELWFLNGEYGKGCEELGYRELYVRWFQYGAFLPMFRSHGTDTPREVWRFGEPGTVFYDTLVKFINLRYRLLPYIYSLAGKTTLENYTMLRLLAFEFRKDKNSHNIDDQFMFGPSIMVNPVTKPMYYEAESVKSGDTDKIRQVYLPKGSDWYDFWTGEKYNGGQQIEAFADIDTMPLFIKAGSIIPMGPIIQYTGENLNAPIELRVYTGADAEFTIYEDEGDNYNYENGAYATTKIVWYEGIKQLVFQSRKGNYNGMALEREFNIVLVSNGYGVGIDEIKDFTRSIVYEGKEEIVKF